MITPACSSSSAGIEDESAAIKLKCLSPYGGFSQLISKPRAELFWAEPDLVVEVVGSVLQLASRRRLRAFLQPDPFGRFVSVMVYLPRDRYTTGSRAGDQWRSTDDGTRAAERQPVDSEGPMGRKEPATAEGELTCDDRRS